MLTVPPKSSMPLFRFTAMHGPVWTEIRRRTDDGAPASGQVAVGDRVVIEDAA